MTVFKFFRQIIWSIIDFVLLIFPDTYRIQRLRGDLFTIIFYGKLLQLTMARRVIIIDSDNLKIGNRVLFANGVWINATGTLEIGSDCQFGPYSIIVTNIHDKDSKNPRSEYRKGSIVIGSNCFIAGNCSINPNVKIGSGTTVGSNSFVKSGTVFLRNQFAAGSPAKVIKKSI